MRVLVHHARFGEQIARRLRAAVPGLDVQLHVEETRIPDDIDRADVVIGMRFPPGMLPRARSMKLLQLTGVGSDHVHDVGDHVVVAHAGSIPARAVAEFACLGALALAHGLAPHPAVQPRTRPLADATMVIVGFGRIGRALARRAAALQMQPLVVVRDARRIDTVDAHGIELVDGSDALARAASRADVLVPAVPLHASTHRLVDARVLDAMPRDGLVINVARHEVADEDALVERLRHGRLAGALLDVHAREPRPSSDALWEVPGLLLTPHCAYRYETHADDVAALCVDTVTRFARGELPVDRRAL